MIRLNSIYRYGLYFWLVKSVYNGVVLLREAVRDHNCQTGYCVIANWRHVPVDQFEAEWIKDL